MQQHYAHSMHEQVFLILITFQKSLLIGKQQASKLADWIWETLAWHRMFLEEI